MAGAIDSAWRAARKRLAATSDTPDLDARLLLEHALGANYAWLIAHAKQALDDASAARYQAALARRSAGEPVAYITGRAGFWSLELAVDRRVLVPRPETETVVEAALARLDDRPRVVADLGTGSGAIALALARERPRWRLLATDNDRQALACARANGQRLGQANVHFVHGDWLAPCPGQHFDAIVANPPYVAHSDAHLDAPELGYEPRQALVAGNQGLAALGRIAAAAPAYLRPGGWLMLEHGANQGRAVRRLLRNAGLSAVKTLADLGGRARVSLGRLGAH